MKTKVVDMRKGGMSGEGEGSGEGISVPEMDALRLV